MSRLVSTNPFRLRLSRGGDAETVDSIWGTTIDAVGNEVGLEMTGVRLVRLLVFWGTTDWERIAVGWVGFVRGVR